MRGKLRLALTAVVSLAVVATTLTFARGSGLPLASQTDALRQAHAATAAANSAAAEPGDETGHDEGHTHDPATKNAVSRSAPTTDAETADPTTPTEAARATASAAAQRDQVEVPLRTVPVSAAQPDVPTNRYNLFNACYGLKSTANNRWLSGTAFTGSTLSGGSPFYFKPSSLGKYLIYTKAKTFLGGSGTKPTVTATKPGEAVNWTVTQVSTNAFRLFLPGAGYLAAGPGGAAAFASSPNAATQLTPFRRTGCTPFPEIGTNVVGNPSAGVSGFQETRGYIDAHTHGMAFEFLGGKVHCGRPWSPWGVTVALVDCPDHTATGGYGAVLEGFLSGTTSHDPVGWPSFKDWPAPNSLTHEGTYYKWMERSWRAGQRILVNLLVENNQLCMLYPLKKNSCDDMKSVALQARDMRALEQYVDAQHGGPGKGWYRIVTDPVQARGVINAGKLAVVMGIETSVLFGCHIRLGRASCTEDSIDQQLTEVRKMGVSQMELVNKFDNALSGVAGDEGSTGYLVNAANTLETGSPWRMTTCDPNVPEEHDRNQDNSAPIPSQDAIFGGILKTLPPSLTGAIPAIPVYPAKNHCNTAGLSDLGVTTIKGMVKRKMLFDPDHMSVKARKQSLDLTQQLGYSGVLSSHSWSTPDAYSRIYDQKGFVAPYAGDSTGFVNKWKRHLTWANPQTYWGIGFGADINGFGAQGSPRGSDGKNPVTYPFTGLGGVKVYKQVSGTRVYDINKDGVSHYGLYPDWVQDLKMIAGEDIVTDLARGAEAYLQTWERAYGVKANACSNPANKHSKAYFNQVLDAGDGWWTVVKTVGQPNRRLDQKFTYCTTTGSLVVNFNRSGQVTSIA